MRRFHSPTRATALRGSPPALARRPLAIIIAAMASQAAVAGPLPNGGINISNVTVTSGMEKTYDARAAVCAVNAASGIAVSADVSAEFTASGTSEEKLGNCTKDGIGDFQNVSYTKTDVTTKLAVTAVDKNTAVPVNLTGGPDYTGTLSSPADDGKYGVTVVAVGTETVTVTPYSFVRRYASTNKTCVGALADPTPDAGKATVINNESTATDKSGYYYVDLAAPTQTHNVTTPSVQQLTNLNLNIHTAGGSSEQPYKQRAGYNDGSSDVWGTEVASTFGKSLADGIAPPNTEAARVLVSCSVPVATGYLSKAQLTETNDLCGGVYAPPAIDSVAQGKDGAAGLFDVTENADCSAVTNQAVVTAPLPPANLLDDPESSASSYALVACFTAQNAGSLKKPKFVSYPGTVHLGTVINSAGDGTSCDDPVAIGDIVFTADSDFDFLKTGRSPQAHVFMGLGDDLIGWPPGFGPGFWYHTGYPLVEIDPALIEIEVNGKVMTISLGNTELGCGAGLLPKGSTLYARGHAKFLGPLSAPGTEHTFETSAAGVNSLVTLIQNPLEGCVDGQLPIPP